MKEKVDTGVLIAGGTEMTETQRKWPDFVSQRDIIAQHEAAVSMLMEEIKRLEAEVERLKCCGNCKSFHHCQFLISDTDVIVKPPENFDCDKWEERK